jgi:hypothetical protein
MIRKTLIILIGASMLLSCSAQADARDGQHYKHANKHHHSHHGKHHGRQHSSRDRHFRGCRHDVRYSHGGHRSAYMASRVDLRLHYGYVDANAVAYLPGHSHAVIGRSY